METERLTQAQAAARLGISGAWLRELGARGVLSRNEDGTYDFPKILGEFEALGAPLGTVSDPSLQTAQRRLLDAKAEALERANKIASGALVPGAFMVATVQELLTAAAKALNFAPRNLAKAVAREIKQPEHVALVLLEKVAEHVRAALAAAGDDALAGPDTST